MSLWREKESNKSSGLGWSDVLPPALNLGESDGKPDATSLPPTGHSPLPQPWENKGTEEESSLMPWELAAAWVATVGRELGFWGCR